MTKHERNVAHYARYREKRLLASKIYYWENREAVLARERIRRSENRATIRAASAVSRLAAREAKAGRPRPDVCEVCLKRPPADGGPSGIVFDHDHETGLFRGWICGRCNRILGLVRDDPSLLRAMAAYLEKAKGAVA